ncbi:MAG TPA: hypothetical protein VGX71_25445 [Pseudaminobacter sp.]|nr:hypothetical protein [Pseudaminobacter sp.]
MVARTVIADTIYWTDAEGNQRWDSNKRIVFADDFAGCVPSEAEIDEIAAVADGFMAKAKAAGHPICAEVRRLYKAHRADMRAARAGEATRQFTAALMESVTYAVGRQLGLLVQAHEQEVAARLKRAAAVRALPTETEALRGGRPIRAIKGGKEDAA